MPELWKPAYSIAAESKPSKPGCWNVNDVQILGPDGNPVGSYSYNYHQRPPFFPFELAGQWYALYSRDYTASRVMKLPSCEDVWGEDRDGFGFCPVEFYVPAYQYLEFGGDRTNKFRGTIHTEPETFKLPGHDPEHDWTYHPVKYHDFGFVCGCIWGDDSSWKIRFFDFAKIGEGVVTYDDRFGYFEMHRDLTLADSVTVYGQDDRAHTRIELCGMRAFTVEGKDPDQIAEAAE